MARIGINGLGRVGRAVLKIIVQRTNHQVVVINDIDPLLSNHAYLLNYDSLYGRQNKQYEYNDKTKELIHHQGSIKTTAVENIADVPWEEHGVEVLIDSSGIYNNVVAAKKKIAYDKLKVIVTHSPKDIIDETIIIGVNESIYDNEQHHIISSSICDANACGPIIHMR